MAYNYYEEAYAKEDLSKCVLEPKIELTIKEAKILLECAYCVDAYTFTNCKKLFNCLERRIEQAEATKICNDYNKDLNKVVEEFQKQEEIINIKCEIEQLKAEQEVDNYLKDQFLKVWRTRNESSN